MTLALNGALNFPCPLCGMTVGYRSQIPVVEGARLSSRSTAEAVAAVIVGQRDEMDSILREHFLTHDIGEWARAVNDRDKDIRWLKENLVEGTQFVGEDGHSYLIRKVD